MSCKDPIITISDIHWDGAGKSVPKLIKAPLSQFGFNKKDYIDKTGEIDRDAFAELLVNWLSDTYGYCMFGFDYEIGE